MNLIIPQNTLQVKSDLERDEEYWQALRTRDTKYYSEFVYAVSSTRVFCRPTCTSRKPESKDRVTFFVSAETAREAGFRPCKRCKPDDKSESTAQLQKIQKLCEFINENWKEKLTLERLSSESGLSPFHLQRTFKKIIGVTPRQYVEAVRLNRVKLSLKSGQSVRKSTYGAGYKTSSWLYFRPNEKLGMSPSKYKTGGDGLVITYSITDSPLGKLLVAATERGICFVSLSDTRQKLEALVRSEYPKAKFEVDVESNDKLYFSVQKIEEYLSKGTDLEKSNLPLDLQSTAFKQRVWKELRMIPYGEVRSYSEVARRMGFPRATRAVANAVASNPVPLIVPCHRVVPKSGGVGEFGLGAERKKALLLKEGVDMTELQKPRRSQV